MFEDFSKKKQKVFRCPFWDDYINRNGLARLGSIFREFFGERWDGRKNLERSSCVVLRLRDIHLSMMLSGKSVLVLDKDYKFRSQILIFPSRKLTCPRTKNHFTRKIVFQAAFLRGYVSFLAGNVLSAFEKISSSFLEVCFKYLDDRVSHLIHQLDHTNKSMAVTQLIMRYLTHTRKTIDSNLSKLRSF